MGTGRMVQLTTTDDGSTWAYESGAGDAPAAVLVLHEWWGLKDHNKGWADELRGLGYDAVALDLYDGRVTRDPEQAAAWMRALDQERVDAKVAGALEHLGATRRPVAVLGCSMGGKQALRAALVAPERVAAVVAAYCRLDTDPETLSPLRAPVLAVYAEQERAWPEKQQAFEAAVADAGGRAEGLSLDAAHGFLDPESARYDRAAARAAWERITAFLHDSLG